jgi:hypothetical protein
MAQAFYGGDAPGVDEAVSRVAADLYGERRRGEALDAWKIFAAAYGQATAHPAQLRRSSLDAPVRAGDRCARL